MGVRLREKDDIKTFILYLLMQIEHPIDLATLNDIAVTDDFVNQFDFMDAFYEISNTDLIAKETTPNGEVFSITPKGRDAAELLKGNIVNTIKERSAYSAMKLLSFSRTGAVSKSKIVESDGKYSLSCSIKTSESSIMSFDIVCDSKDKALSFKDNFDSKPEFIYRAILSVISGDMNYLADSWIKDENVDTVDDVVESNMDTKTTTESEETKVSDPPKKEAPKRFSLFKKNK